MVRPPTHKELHDQEWQTFLALFAVKAAHDDEGCCQCPWDRCILRKPWAKRIMAKYDATTQFDGSSERENGA